MPAGSALPAGSVAPELFVCPVQEPPPKTPASHASGQLSEAAAHVPFVHRCASASIVVPFPPRQMHWTIAQSVDAVQVLGPVGVPLLVVSAPLDVLDDPQAKAPNTRASQTHERARNPMNIAPGLHRGPRMCNTHPRSGGRRRLRPRVEHGSAVAFLWRPDASRHRADNSVCSPLVGGDSFRGRARTSAARIPPGEQRIQPGRDFSS